VDEFGDQVGLLEGTGVLDGDGGLRVIVAVPVEVEVAVWVMVAIDVSGSVTRVNGGGAGQLCHRLGGAAIVCDPAQVGIASFEVNAIGRARAVLHQVVDICDNLGGTTGVTVTVPTYGVCQDGIGII